MPVPPSTVPTSTYRLQITDDFTLSDAADRVGYLAELGVGAVYVSPLLASVDGSTHGYDVVDHTRVDEARGGTAGLAELAEACRWHGLGLVVDIVPNHMGVEDASQNHAWWEVLRLGRDAPTAHWFDIDWQINDGRVLIPVLGDAFDARRDLTVVDGELHYYEHRYPIAPGTGPATGETAAQVHDRQHYELVSYRRADTDQNYRRFFAVTTLAGLRVEDPDVFDATHAEILRWVADYGVTGIRIDHPDGLVDPGGYLDRLAGVAPNTWITVEKITEPGERLPAAWPVAGMTGYDALTEVNSVLVDPAAAGDLSKLYAELTGDERDWEQHVADGKRLIVTTILQAEIRRMARLVPEVHDAVPALAELVIAFEVYRSYLPLGGKYLTAAVQTATGRRPELAAAINALLPRLQDPTDELCSRFQQTTGAVMAKGVEDTAYYRYSRLISLNEVGGYPGTFGSGIAGLHAALQRRADAAPAGMTTLSTHDTKRGEDIRARIAVLAELRAEWADLAHTLISRMPLPNQSFGYLLWQTFVGTGLIEKDRMHAYAEKAMREAADGTGWIDPNADFEAAVHGAVDSGYDDPEFAALIEAFAQRITPYAQVNSLTQKLVQLTMPGVPDVYQGSELVEDSLVDPDNRRPVDFDHRSALLAALAAGHRPVLKGAATEDAALVKLWLVRQALHARRDRPELFTGYFPLSADGPARDHLIAFDRGGAITVATRLPVGLEQAGSWGDTTLTLPSGHYTDALTGRTAAGTIAVGDLLSDYPVALLMKGTN
jgi:(1->4)-alpha-D-glucan 1-alpha-D-glucosylmutase